MTARRAAPIAVVLTAVLLLWPALGSHGLWAPDEPRIGQVAEELRAGAHDPRHLVLLHLHGEVYTQKPPLYYWMAAALGAPAGRVSEWSARFPSAAAGVLCIVLTLLLGRQLVGPAAAGWGALLLLLTHGFPHLARRAQLDVVLTAFELLALLAWLRLERGAGARTSGLALLHASLGAAALTKGPVGWLPLAVIAIHLVWEGRAHELRALLAPRWLVLSLGPFLAWGGLALALAPTGFFDAAVVDNMVGRFLRGSSHARPFYYYLLQLPLDFAPTSLLLPLAGFAAARGLRAEPTRGGARESVAGDRSAWRLLVVWVATFLAFFSLSAGKRGLYLLPAFPALALACGAGLSEALARRRRLPGRLGLALSALALLIAALGLSDLGAALFQRLAEHERFAQAGVSTAAAPPRALWRWFGSIGATAVLGAGALVLVRASATSRAIWSAICALALHAFVFFGVQPLLDPERSPRPIAEAASALALPGEPIGVFPHASLAAGVAYYASNPVIPLREREAVQRYLREGGRVLVIVAKREVETGGTGDLTRRARFRSGRREIWVLAPQDRSRTALRAPGGG